MKNVNTHQGTVPLLFLAKGVFIIHTICDVTANASPQRCDSINGVSGMNSFPLHQLQTPCYN